MRIPTKLFEALSDADRLLDRLNEAVALDFADARDNNSRAVAPDVVAATAAAREEYERLVEALRESGGARFLGPFKAVREGATLSALHEKAMPLVRKITALLRKAEPDVRE
ncbi:MAG TPA: hypothetical protein VGG02_13855 [Chthoniobacterales bacterium]|jgi:hypothetical protein